MISESMKKFTATPSNLAGQSSWAYHVRLLAAASAIILVLFGRDSWQMVVTWWDVSTYNHCLLVVPILAWLVAQRHDELIKIRPRFWIGALIWVGAGSVGWMLGEAAGVAFARHLGLIMILQGTVAALLGPAVTRGLLFPLFFSFFLVPVGEELVPALQTITAKISMILLGWTNIPAFIDGIFISTPTGYFEVAEACSGVKFLIAMIAYGALVSNVCFQSWKRRAIFMSAALIIPILANGIRAFGTIYIAHHTSIDFASGFDHIFYGWFFFAFILIMIMAIGWPFFDRKIDDRMIDGDRLAALDNGRMSHVGAGVTLASLAAVILLPMVWTAALAAQSSPVPDKIILPQVAGWEQVAYEPRYEWKPRFDGASHQLLGRYRNSTSGAVADLAIAVYDRQEEGREIVGYAQGAHDPETKWSWNRELAAPPEATAIEMIAPGPVVRDAVTFYRIGGKSTGSGTAVKLETLKSKLLGGDQHAVAVIVSSEKVSDDDPRKAIDAFLGDLGPVDKLADEMAGLR